jgi:signal transduction histidine kinase
MTVRLAPWGVVESDLVAAPVTRRNAAVLRRFPTRHHGARFWLALWTFAVAVEVGVLVPVLFPDGKVESLDVAFRLVGGAFMGCGLIAWHRRPDSRSGLLMAVAGVGFSVSPLLGQLDAALAQTLATLLTDVWTVPFVALLLTYVTGGRVETTVDRVLLAGIVVGLLVLQFVWMLFLGDDGNLLSAFPDAGVANVVDKAQRVLVMLTCVATITVIVARWRVASPARRRALAPSIAGAIALALFVSLLVNDLFGTGERAQTHLWLAIMSLLLVPAAFLAGLLRSRLARAGLTDLIRDLRAMRGPDLQSALARAMGDPRLVVARRANGGAEYVDATGAAVTMPTTAGDRRIVPVQRDGHEIAAIVYDASLDDDPPLVEAVSAAAAIALENEELHRESQERLAELRASRARLVTASDAERRRLERDLHDGAQQRLVALAMQLRFLQSRIREDPATAEELATTVSAELAQSLQELRELARGIHPAVLDHGLETALESLVSRSPVPATLRFDASDSLPPAVELAVYFVVSEALTNVAKYARATAATVSVAAAPGRLVVAIADDGIGGADAADGSGLRGLNDRVEALGGRLRVVSARGAGTTVTAELPCGS